MLIRMWELLLFRGLMSYTDIIAQVEQVDQLNQQSYHNYWEWESESNFWQDYPSSPKG